jgi:hypothetical protein
MAPKECRVYKVLKTILCQVLREKMMFGFDTVIVQERALAGVWRQFHEFGLSAHQLVWKIGQRIRNANISFSPGKRRIDRNRSFRACRQI